MPRYKSSWPASVHLFSALQVVASCFACIHQPVGWLPWTGYLLWHPISRTSHDGALTSRESTYSIFHPEPSGLVAKAFQSMDAVEALVLLWIPFVEMRGLSVGRSVLV